MKTENLNRPIRKNNIESVIKKSSNKERPNAVCGFAAEFYQTFQEELIPLLQKLPLNIEMEGILF